jgi:hypothetical protein
MNASWQNRLPLILAAALAGAALVAMARVEPARAGGDAASGAAPRYSVVETEAHNLIVTDNQTNTVYFYTIDKDQKPGAELKLRGSIDLSQVGKPTIKPMTTDTDK